MRHKRMTGSMELRVRRATARSYPNKENIRCFYCKKPNLQFEKTIEHLIPVSESRCFAYYTVYSCHKCNSFRGQINSTNKNMMQLYIYSGSYLKKGNTKPIDSIIQKMTTYLDNEILLLIEDFKAIKYVIEKGALYEIYPELG